jgi:hypothetical protein
MGNKIAWQDVYKDFRQRHPNLRKNSCGFEPSGYLSIIIFFKDKTKMSYDYTTKECKFIV